MTITEGMKRFRLPNPATPEDLACRWNHVINFGDRVLLAGGFYNGPDNPCYFGVVYEYLNDSETHTCESEIGIRAVSDVEFYDEGHAIAWAMKQD